MSAGRESLEEARYEVSFFIGPCPDTEADALAEAILNLPEFKAVGGGGVGTTRIVCACGTPLIVCTCGDDRCPKCDPDGCPGG